MNYKSLATKLAAFGVIGVAAVGMTKCNQKWSKIEERRAAELIEKQQSGEFFDTVSPKVRLYTPGDNIGGDYYLWDVNNDGEADSIGFMGTAYWVAEDMKSKVNISSYTRTMTQEIREKASSLLKENRDLAHLVVKEYYQQDQL